MLLRHLPLAPFPTTSRKLLLVQIVIRVSARLYRSKILLKIHYEYVFVFFFRLVSTILYNVMNLVSTTYLRSTLTMVSQKWSRTVRRT
jgi:hypothetical protein